MILRNGMIVAGLAAMAVLGACAPVIFGGVATGAVSTAQTRSTGEALTDAEIKLRISDALLQEDSTLFSQVETSVTEGRVVLLGAVSSQADRQRAEQLAMGINDVREVINELIVADRGWREIASDTRIDTEISARILGAEDVLSVNYDIETVNGTVHVMGLARSMEELQRVTEIASRVSGVRQVVSHALLTTDPRRRRDNT